MLPKQTNKKKCLEGKQSLIMKTKINEKESNRYLELFFKWRIELPFDYRS